MSFYFVAVSKSHARKAELHTEPGTTMPCCAVVTEPIGNICMLLICINTHGCNAWKTWNRVCDSVARAIPCSTFVITCRVCGNLVTADLFQHSVISARLACTGPEGKHMKPQGCGNAKGSLAFEIRCCSAVKGCTTLCQGGGCRLARHSIA
jgi:hypothetical protein